MPTVTVNTPAVSAPHILNVSFIGLKPEVIVHALEEHGVYISTKSACSSKVKEVSHVLLEMGLGQRVAESAIRISFSGQNTMEEIQQFQEIMQEIVSKLYQVMR
jgi:cysteine desulfurase